MIPATPWRVVGFVVRSVNRISIGSAKSVKRRLWGSRDVMWLDVSVMWRSCLHARHIHSVNSTVQESHRFLVISTHSLHALITIKYRIEIYKNTEWSSWSRDPDTVALLWRCPQASVHWCKEICRTHVWKPGEIVWPLSTQRCYTNRVRRRYCHMAHTRYVFA